MIENSTLFYRYSEQLIFYNNGSLIIGNHLNNSSLLSGQVTNQTVTIILKDVKVSDPQFVEPTLANFGQQSFEYENKNWTVLEVTPGNIHRIGDERYYRTFTFKLVAVDSEVTV